MVALNSPRATANVLMVEDNDDHAYLIRDAIETARPSIELRRVDNASAAMRDLDRVSARLPDLILLDLKMPGMNGHDLLAWLKAQESLRDIPVIIFTSSSDPDDRCRAYLHRADSYIVKPMNNADFELMLEELDHHLDRADRQF